MLAEKQITQEAEAGVSSAIEELVMPSIPSSDSKRVTAPARCEFTFGDVIKIGGPTVGGAAIGSAIGNMLGPAGAASGALIGGGFGAAVSTWDLWTHHKDR